MNSVGLPNERDERPLSSSFRVNGRLVLTLQAPLMQRLPVVFKRIDACRKVPVVIVEYDVSPGVANVAFMITKAHTPMLDCAFVIKTHGVAFHNFPVGLRGDHNIFHSGSDSSREDDVGCVP